ncbi:MAG: peptidoglycan-binding protein, partial [Armatimonadota bacterium]|nr:peptidoglycan-binding protein [Armatimonadota bacterium]
GTSTFFTDNGYPEIVGAESQKFVVTISTTTGVVASGTFAVISGATTTAPFTADIHSQLPATANISPNYNSSNGVYSISSNGGAGEAGTLNIYSTSTPGVAPFASRTLSTTGPTSASLGTTYYPSIWLDATDIVGNVTSSKVEFVLSTYKPTVTGFSAFTDRIIINVNKNLRGDQAMVCSNYNLNGSALSCSGGPGTPFIEFFGNQVIVKNVTLSGTMSFSVTGLIQSIGTDQFAFTFSTSSIPVQTASVPTITAVSPDTGTAGDTVTLTGTNFGSASGTLLFSGGFDPSTGPKQPIQASTTAWSSTSITTVVPTGGQSGPIQVVNSSGMMSDVNQSTFFSILGNAYIKLALSVSSTPVTTSTNMRIFIGGPTGEHIYYAGDASSTAFNTSTYVYTLPNIPGMGFVWAYDASGVKLSAPGTMLQTGTTSSTPQILVFPTSTPYNVSGTVTLGTSCVNAFKNQNIAVMAMPQGQNVEMGPGGIQPSFFTTNNSCQAAYAIALKATSTYNVEAHLPPGTSAVGLLDPSGQTIVIATSTPTATADFTFTSASHSIYGRIVGGDGLALTADKYNNLWIFAYQPVENGQGTAGRADSSGYFRMYASTGAYKVSVGGPQMPMGFEQDVLVTTSTAYDVDAATPVITIKLSPPTSYIDGYVKDGSSNAIANADVFSYCADGPGGGHSTTDSQGYYKMYVPPCTDYHVNGFSSTYGQFIEQTGIAITGSGSATVNFTINSSDFITISGTVTKNGSAVSGANVWITQGNFGPGVAGGQTDSSGAFSLMVKSGLSNLYVHAAVMGQGELANQQLAAGGTVSSNQTGINLSATAAVLTIQLSPGDTFSQVFLGAHSNSGGGFTNTAIATSTAYDTYQISVPYSGGSTSYTIDGGIPNFGPLPATTTIVTGNATIAIDLSSISYYTVSGSVNGDYAGAFVWAGGTTGGGGTQVNSSGTFSMKLRAGTYDIGVSKPGFIASLLSQQVISTTTAGLSLSLTQSTNTISGTVYYNSTAVSGVRVWADSSGGGWVGDETDANGEFSLSVSPGDWRLRAITDGYSLATPILVTAPVSGISVNLSAVSFQPKQQLQSISPSQGGVVQTSDTQVQVPQGALGSGSTNVQLSVSNTMSTPDKKGAKVIGTGKNISASYASGDNQGQAITTLSSNVTLEFILTKAQLVADGISSLSQAQNMQIGYDDTTSNSWVYIQTTVTASSSDGTWANLESITLSGTTSHFSTYAPVVPTSGSAPATPTGVTATAGNGQVTVSWSAVSGATKYDIYRLSGANYAYFAQTTDTSYANTGLTNGTTYYYEVSALDDSDNESAVSSPVSAAPTAGSVQIISQGGGGGGGGGYVAPTTTATTTIPVATTTPPAATPVTPATPPQAATPNLPPQAISAIFKTVLKLGSQGKDVTRLQELLAKDAEVYPEGKVTGYFGALTEKAVQRFQKKYGIASSGSPSTTGYGILGPKTRAKLAEVFAGTAVPPAASFSGTTLSPSNGPSAPPAVANQAELKAKIQVLQQQVLILLQQLMQLLSAKAGT